MRKAEYLLTRTERKEDALFKKEAGKRALKACFPAAYLFLPAVFRRTFFILRKSEKII